MEIDQVARLFNQMNNMPNLSSKLQVLKTALEREYYKGRESAFMEMIQDKVSKNSDTVKVIDVQFEVR